MAAVNPDPITQLEEKMHSHLLNGKFYEAQQYVQSFVARKKKVLGQSVTSTLVFHGARLLLNANASSDAGSLLVWFIEDDAGADYGFKLEKSELSGDKYCDCQRLLELLSSQPADKIAPMVDKIYGPVHIYASKDSITKSSPLYTRLTKLEEIFANSFESVKKWNSAYKAMSRIADSSRMSSLLNSWAMEGYKCEQPLFFCRAVLQLLGDNKVELAADLVAKSKAYVVETDDSTMMSSLAAWHVAVILSGLASLPPMPRVDKTKLFGLLMQLYYQLLARTDPKLAELLDKIGYVVFKFANTAPQNEPPNPMTLIKNMLSGVSSSPKAPSNAGPSTAGGFDVQAMMQMINQMQASRR